MTSRYTQRAYSIVFRELEFLLQEHYFNFYIYKLRKVNCSFSKFRSGLKKSKSNFIF